MIDILGDFPEGFILHSVTGLIFFISFLACSTVEVNVYYAFFFIIKILKNTSTFNIHYTSLFTITACPYGKIELFRKIYN